MESLSTVISASPPLKNHHKTLNPFSSKSIYHHPNTPILFPRISSSRPINFLKKIPLLPLLKNPLLHFTTIEIFSSLPCFASDTVITNEQVSDRINLESIVVSIDDFFNRYPFFVAGCTFVWLIGIPLANAYFNKYRYVSAIDAFKMLRDDPNVQLLDIRDDKSLAFLGSPRLQFLSKSARQVEYSEGDEDRFVKKVLGKFEDPGNTIVCVLDNLDGNSLKAAELLFKNGFREALAIRGGVRGKKGWVAIQETLLPPSVHIKPKKKVRISQNIEVNGGVSMKSMDSSRASTSTSAPVVKTNRSIDQERQPVESNTTMENGSRSSSPYPNYPDLKPPSSPTPPKPQS